MSKKIKFWLSIFSTLIIIVIGVFIFTKQVGAQETTVISGVKYMDINQNGIKDEGETLLNDWEICLTEILDGNDELVKASPTCVYTGSDDYGWPDGYYEFSISDYPEYPAVFQITETLQNGWIQTAPATGYYEITVEEPAIYSDNDFGNYRYSLCGNSQLDLDQGEQCDGDLGIGEHQKCVAPGEANECTIINLTYCGDGEKQTPNDDGINEECDGESGITNEHQTCTLNCTLETEPYCGDGYKNQETEQCDGNDGITEGYKCTNDCKLDAITTPETPTPEIKKPILSIVKIVDKATANPSDKLAYTVTVSNTGKSDAVNVTLTDNLPAGLTFLDENGNNTGNITRTWAWDKLSFNTNVTVKYDVLVDSSVGAGTYENLAKVTAENFDGEVTAKTVTNVTIPKVLAEKKPSLTITKIVDMAFANPGDTVNYTVTVTNDGSALASNVILDDKLPDGLTFIETGETTANWKLGDIATGASVNKIYKVKLDLALLPNKYLNTATAKADNTDSISAQATLEVADVKVLGEEEKPKEEVKVLGVELPDTGSGILTILSGFILAGAGIYLRKKTTNK